jgi:hypothetical protein
MNKWKMVIPILALSMSVIVGSTLGFAFKTGQGTGENNSHSVRPITSNLEEEFWNVDLIVKGTVSGQDDTFKKDAGVPGKQNFSFDVTPAKVNVEKVLYGNVDSNTITYLQHGSSKDQAISQEFVKKGEEVILILVKTSDGKYWSYNFDDGLWKIKDGKVNSNADSERLAKFKGYNADKFMSEISEVAKNKRKNKEYKQ